MREIVVHIRLYSDMPNLRMDTKSVSGLTYSVAIFNIKDGINSSILNRIEETIKTSANSGHMIK